MKKVFKTILSVILIILGVLFIISGIAINEPVIWVPGIIIVLTAIKASGRLPSDKRKEEEKLKEKQKLEEMGYLTSANLTHEAGLPIAENILCKIDYFKDKIVIEGSGTIFNLSTDKIMDISIKTDTEIETFYNSSIGGAVAGAFVLGPLGAMIGGRRKKKEVKKTESFLVITYDKDDEVNFIVFNTKTDPFKANKLVKFFRESGIKSQKTIEL